MDDNYIYAIKGDSIVKYDVKSKNLKVIFESKMEFSTINNGIALPR